MLARRYRFHGHGSLKYLFKHGKTVRGHFLLLRYIENEKRPHGRVAVVISKKVAKSAVVRNRIRRRIFEAVRTAQPQLKGGHDLAFIVLSRDLEVVESTYVTKDVALILKRAGIWKSSVAKQIDA